MIEPHEKPMKMQWITVDGRSVPIVLPQIWDYELEDWVVTSADNPIPTQLTGSNVALDVKTTKSNTDRILAENVTISAGSNYIVNGIDFFGTRIGIGVRFSET